MLGTSSTSPKMYNALGDYHATVIYQKSISNVGYKEK